MLRQWIRPAITPVPTPEMLGRGLRRGLSRGRMLPMPPRKRPALTSPPDPMTVVWRPVDVIHPCPDNPRQIPREAVTAVAESLRAFGWRQPIVIDGEGVIIAGHTRHAAALALGMDTVPTVVADDLTPAQAAAYRIIDNRTADLAAWDAGGLVQVLDDLDAVGDDLGLDMAPFAFDDLLASLGVLDVPEVPPPELPDGDRSPDALGTITIRLSVAECEEIRAWLDTIKPRDPSGALLLVCRGAAAGAFG